MIRIRTRPRGPLVLELDGDTDLELLGTEGQVLDLDGRKKLMLCRCGASSTRPLCDGAHNRIGFEAPPPAEPSGDDPPEG